MSFAFVPNLSDLRWWRRLNLRRSNSSPIWGTSISREAAVAKLRLEELECRLVPSLTAHLLKDINPGTASSAPLVPSFANVNGVAYFTANDGVHGLQVWKSNGTAAGTTLVRDIGPGSQAAAPYYLTNVNGTVFFNADDGVHGRQLWKSNGTQAGTVMVKDIGTGAREGPYLGGPEDLINLNGTLFFSDSDPTHGRELWRSNGTAAGTVLVKDIDPGKVGGVYFPKYTFTNVNGTLFFDARDGVHPTSLWRSNGTAAGTVMVKEFNSFKGETNYPFALTNVNGTLFFDGDDSAHGAELWRSNGTAAGTVLVKDIEPGSKGSKPQFLTNVNGTLFFEANDGVHGGELWRSNGTAAGTVAVRNINPGFYSLTNINGTLFFDANDGVHGTELWRSNGTAAGTVMVKDINLGIAGSFPAYLTNVNRALFFEANDGIHGSQLWESNGTAAGTVLFQQIGPGGHVGSYPGALTNVNGTLFFFANDSVHGTEPWILGPLPPATSAPPAAANPIFPAAGSASNPSPAQDPGGNTLAHFAAAPEIAVAAQAPSTPTTGPGGQVAGPSLAHAHYRHVSGDESELLEWFTQTE
jgi:ELWxxDGT repeat protein